jgi:hypothetical protein
LLITWTATAEQDERLPSCLVDAVDAMAIARSRRMLDRPRTPSRRARAACSVLLLHLEESLFNSWNPAKGSDMSDYSGGDADRETFLAALGRVFAEHRGVSEGYALCDLERLGGMVGGGFDGPVRVNVQERGRILTTFSDEFPNPIANEIGDECVALIPNFTTDPPSWDCIMYLTS